MKRMTASRHYRSEGNEEVLETGLLLQKVKAIAAHALFAAVCLCLFCGLIQVRAGAQDADPPRIVHVFVALADNQHQGIIPVPAKLGNGDDPNHNLYWGAAYGIKTFFARSAEWQLLAPSRKPKAEVLERCVFKHRTLNVYLVADALSGKPDQAGNHRLSLCGGRAESRGHRGSGRVTNDQHSRRRKRQSGGLREPRGADGFQSTRTASRKRSYLP